MVEDLKEGRCWKRYETTLERHSGQSALNVDELEATIFKTTKNTFLGPVILNQWKIEATVCFSKPKKIVLCDDNNPHIGTILVFGDHVKHS